MHLPRFLAARASRSPPPTCLHRPVSSPAIASPSSLRTRICCSRRITAVPLSGGVLVALNSRLAPAELAYILEHSGARILLVDSEFTASAEAATNMLDDPPTVIGSGAPQAGTHRPTTPGGPGHRRALIVVHQLHQRNHGATQGGDVPPPRRLPAGTGDGPARQARPRLPVSVDAADVPHERVVLSMGGHRCRGCPPLPSLHRHDGDLGAQSSRASPISARRRRCCRCWCRRHPRNANAAIASVYSPGGAPPWPALLRQLEDLGIDVEAPLRADGDLRTGRGVRSNNPSGSPRRTMSAPNSLPAKAWPMWWRSRSESSTMRVPMWRRTVDRRGRYRSVGTT